MQASGYSKKHPGDRYLEEAVESMRNAEYNSDDDIDVSEDRSEEESDSDYDYYYTEEDEESGEDSDGDSEEEENERIIEALSSGVGNLKMDKLGNYILED